MCSGPAKGCGWDCWGWEGRRTGRTRDSGKAGIVGVFVPLSPWPGGSAGRVLGRSCLSAHEESEIRKAPASLTAGAATLDLTLMAGRREDGRSAWKVPFSPDAPGSVLRECFRCGRVQLGQGVLVQVSPSLVKRQKTHFHDLPCGASVILGNNGFIWIYPTPEHKEEDAGGFIANLEPVSLTDREVISRLRNCIVSLVTQRMMLYDTSILYCYEASLPHQIKDILKPEIMEEIVMETRQRLLEQEG
uniref:Exosome component 2 n=1 Tax=Suricata suricatta TaxID=37032 RepID=A0A673TFT5_SURSU